MYAVPTLFGPRDFLQLADQMKMEICKEDCCFMDYPCDSDVFDLCMELVTEHNVTMITTIR